MVRELLERLAIAIASAALALLLSCALASPPTASRVGVDQQTDAQQITIQAAPDSDVAIDASRKPGAATKPP